jgi:eukaryotic-like serine/threonine-protein kinase
LQPGSTVGPYVVRRHLGDGGMGSVWLAEDTRLHRHVALKTLHASRMTDEAGRERLMREARAAAALNHPNIATVYDVLDIGGDVTIVFEHVDGPTLATALADGRLPLERVLQIGIQLVKALVAAHQQGVVHRDLKPSNVIVGNDGGIKVLDFGIARLMPAASTRTSPVETGSAVFLGTPAYAAPEQLFTSAVDERADLYSLGVMLFEMAAGRRPYAGRDLMEVAAAKLSEKPPSLSSTGALVPPAFDALVTQLLSQHPADRPASAAEVLGSLRTIAGDKTGPLPLLRVRSTRWIAATVVLSAIIVGLLLGLKGPGVKTVSASQPVVAVLPLRNTSSDPSQDYLAAGLSESLIAGLAASPSLIVLSRTAVAEAVKGQSSIVAAAFRELGASYIIDGSVQRSGDQLRISISLVGPNQSIAWGRTFDGTVDKVFELQTFMALAVSEAMSAGRPATRASPPTNQAALESYWRGRAFLDRWDLPGNIDAAVSSMQESVSTDGTFALAHAGLGLAYWQKYNVTRDQELARLAIEEGSKAAAIDPNLPEVHYALAVSLNGTGRRDEAIRELRRAIELRPTFDEARRRLGIVLAADNKIDEAVSEFQAAIALRPKYWGGYSDMGIALLNAARYDEALKAFEQVVALQPDNNIGYQQLGTVYQTIGDTPKAIAAYEQSLSIRGSFGAYSNLGMLQHLSGHYPEAIAAYQKAIEFRPGLASLYRNVGDAYVKMGKAAEARAAYGQAIAKTEADLAVNPKNARNVAALAVYLVKAGRTADGLERIATALKLAPDDVQVTVRAAVVNSLAGRRDEALKHVATAIKRGYSVRAIQEEEDFASLRTMAQFNQLVQERQAR